jgi:hypothetical protein
MGQVRCAIAAAGLHAVEALGIAAGEIVALELIAVAQFVLARAGLTLCWIDSDASRLWRGNSNE